MDEGFRNWVYKLALPKIFISDDYLDMSIPVVVLIEAMWAINRAYRNNFEGFCLDLRHDSIYINLRPHSFIYFKDYNNSEQQALEAALKYIYEQETKNQCTTEWISTEDRLPSRNQVVRIKGDRRRYGCLIQKDCIETTKYYHSEIWERNVEQDEDYIFVTHWMPFPKPPQETNQ